MAVSLREYKAEYEGELMRIEDYTPDAICMALEGRKFRDDELFGQNESVLRLLLRPSFDPEVCITLGSGLTEDWLELCTFHEMFWHKASAADRPAVFKVRVAIVRGSLDNCTRDFVEAHRLLEETSPKNWMVLDGMPVSAICSVAGSVLELDLNVGARDEFHSFVANILNQLFPLIPPGPCRNSIVRAGRYVDLRLPIDTLPKIEAGTRLLILGEEKGKREVTDALDREVQRRPKKGGSDESP